MPRHGFRLLSCFYQARSTAEGVQLVRHLYARRIVLGSQQSS